jgi:hypothetical protein
VLVVLVVVGVVVLVLVVGLAAGCAGAAELVVVVCFEVVCVVVLVEICEAGAEELVAACPCEPSGFAAVSDSRSPGISRRSSSSSRSCASRTAGLTPADCRAADSLARSENRRNMVGAQ